IKSIDQQSAETGSLVEVHYIYSPTINFPVLPARIETSLYRIAQEALTNAYRHAYSQHIEVTLTASDQLIHLITQDDGCGFSDEIITEAGGQGHFGLTGMNERVKLL